MRDTGDYQPGLAAVILAAGFSSRMGRLKAALPIPSANGETTALARCISLFTVCGVEEIIVVTGHQAAAVAAIAQGKATVVHNAEYALGMYGSIQVGLRQARHRLGQRLRGCFLLPVDMPFIQAATARLLARELQNGVTLALPFFAGITGHPPLLAASLVDAILTQAEPPSGLQSLFTALQTEHPEQTRRVAVDDAAIHVDMDSPEDYRRALALFATN
ncbi:MAG: nucleotidyltransferase family protein [Desulfobulbaceae bacterium]|jgi:CTP:molybdopterin cytidylyltransferase MocA|nr:nucleotidyltransferase family protein [Desulfobulbaceae bacterium]